MKLGEIATLVAGELYGDPEYAIARPAPSDADDPAAIGFAESDEYLLKMSRSGLGAGIIPQGKELPGKHYICVASPRRAFHLVLRAFEKRVFVRRGVHTTAIVDPAAVVDSEACIGPYVVVEAGAVVRAGAQIHPFCYVGPECVLGENVVLYPHVVLYGWVRIGRDSVVHAGTVLGADGFGYVWTGNERVKVPHVGGVDIGQEVEIGALSTIDRATMGQTQIGNGTKLDNLVQIAHNARVGEHCAIAAQVGISGSAQVGDRVVMAGQTGVADGVTIGSDTSFGGRSAVIGDTVEPGEYLGYPARPLAEAKRAMILFGKLPELVARIRKLERKED